VGASWPWWEKESWRQSIDATANEKVA
jgi:hypothetical protein